MQTAKQCRTKKALAISLSAALALGMLPLTACVKKEPAHHDPTEIVEQPAPVADEQSILDNEVPEEKAGTEAAELKKAANSIVSQYEGPSLSHMSTCRATTTSASTGTSASPAPA